MKIVVDAYAWVEIFIGSERGDRAKEILTKADEVYTAGVVLAEIARKYLKEGAKERTILERLTTIEDVSDIIPIDKNVALESAKCYMQLLEKAKITKLKLPSLFDAIVLATAKLFNAKVLTGDEHFKDLSQTLWIR